MSGAWLALAGGALFSLGVCAGAFLLNSPPAHSQGAAPTGLVVKPVGELAPGIAELRLEVHKLADEFARIREQMALGPAEDDFYAHRDDSSEVRKLSEQDNNSTSFQDSSGGAVARKGDEERERRRSRDERAIEEVFSDLGLSDGERGSIAAHLPTERFAIQERFRSQIGRQEWEEFRALKSRGWRRLLPEEREKMLRVENRFKEIQEETLRAYAQAGFYQFLTPFQRESIEFLRGGFLDVSPDGEPVVKAFGERARFRGR